MSDFADAVSKMIESLKTRPVPQVFICPECDNVISADSGPCEHQREEQGQ